MNYYKKIALGFLSILPLIYFIIFISILITVILQGYNTFVYFIDTFGIIIAFLHGIALLLLISLSIFYIFHAAQNIKLSNSKAKWIVLLILFGPISIPIYWLLFISKYSRIAPQ